MVRPIILHSAHPLKASCKKCSLSGLCLPLAVSDEDLGRLEDIVLQGRIYNRNELVFEQGQTFRSCFAVRSGAVKSYVISENGEEQVTGFYLPGELVGLDSMGSDRYACTAQALERTSVCELPVTNLEVLTQKLPGLQHHFFQRMSQEIQNSHHLSLLLSKHTAEERIATLLLSLSRRFGRRKLSTTHFNLPMSRIDIANYLGLAVETVSRVFTRFQTQRILKVHGRGVELLDLTALHAATQIAVPKRNLG